MVNPFNKEPLPPDGTIYKEDCFEPLRLRDLKTREKLLENICEKVSKATPILSAFISCGIPRPTYYLWKSKYEEEMEEIKGTNYRTMITEFFNTIYETERETEGRLGGVMFNKAIYEEDIDATKYLLDKRYKWKETKQVELDNPTDTKFELNIVPMKDEHKKEEDEE